MRLSEKTLEINICSQLQWYPLPFALPSSYPFPWPRLFWFGLTQAQEARAGFDTYTKIGGRLFILQFKASQHVLRSGARRFHAPHDQFAALQKHLGHRKRSVYYVLPNIGTTSEIAKSRFLLPSTWLLDVADIPSLAPPTTTKGILRKSRMHYVDLFVGSGTPKAIIRSEAVPVPLHSSEAIFTANESDVHVGLRPERFEEIMVYRDILGRNTVAVVIS